MGLVLSDSRTVRKVTIVPRGRAGGYAIMLPRDDQFLLTKKELNEQIVGLMGGRTAEEIIFGTLNHLVLLMTSNKQLKLPAVWSPNMG
jgi:cell division protease FtsH